MRSLARRTRFACAFVALLVTGCGGGAVTTRSSGMAPIGGNGISTVSVKLLIPAAAHASSAMRRLRGGTRKPRFVAETTAGISVDVYAQSDAAHSSLLASSTTDISSGSAACGGTVGLPRTCNVAIAAPAGADAFVFRTYDAAPSGGSFGSAPQLGAGLVNQTIAANQTNTVAVTLGGVVSSVLLSLSAPALHFAPPATQTLTVIARDADGNAIVTDGYVDANDDPVAIALSASEDANTSVTLAAASLSAPATNGVRVTYSGIAAAAFTSTITATLNGAAVGTTALAVLAPAFSEYAVPTAGSGPNEITTGSDGALWFTEQSSGLIGRVTTSGSVSEYPVRTADSDPQYIAAGIDGALWFAEQAGNNIGRITTGGAVTEFAVPTPGSGPRGITGGPDGALWFTELYGKKIGRITTGGAITEYALSAASNGALGITSGPDGALWFGEGTGKIGRITTGGSITEYAIPSGNHANDIVSGSDGALWFVESGAANAIGRITTGGTVTEFALPSAGSYAFTIASGADGALWFTEVSGNRIGRIPVTATPANPQITEYTVPTGGSSPTGITSGPDGALWFTELAGGKVGSLL